MKQTATGLAALVLLLIAGCTTGGPDDAMALRKLTWFSYLNGDDLRAGCTAGAPERLRLVYNADYAVHVRTYDLSPDPATGGATLAVRVLPAANLAALALGDILSPWRGIQTSVSLSPGQRAELWSRVAAAGGLAPPPGGLSLSSEEIYWLVAGCHQGQAFVTARRVSETGAPPAFAPLLAALDTSGVAFPDLAARHRRLGQSPPRHSQDSSLAFTILITDQGLWGAPRF
ncbi:MAG: hypothetical protein WCO00_12795 [Rhodospirillaceae bacterium]